jgi:glycosyltransferase involved in cell wall biosynthesis
MPAVFKSIPNARLIIVGDGDDKRRLEQLTEKLNLRDRIEFMGFISEDEKIEWLNKAWVVVNPSSKEGWGLTMTEANACGTPVVAADSPGLRDAVKDGETGLLYQYGNIDALSHSIVKILYDGNLRDKLREGGLIYARKYTWDVSAEMTLELMEKIIAER